MMFRLLSIVTCSFFIFLSLICQGQELKKVSPAKHDTLSTIKPKKQKAVKVEEGIGIGNEKSTPTIDERGNVVIPPDIEPSFPGGKMALDSFISKYLVYPDEAFKLKAEGIVIVTFSVEVDGSVNSPKIITDKVGHGAAEEVKRLISLMPRWKPAFKDGMAMPVYYSMPVKFKIKN